MNLVDAHFRERRNFSFLLHQRDVWHAVEVGTDRGHFARQLLSGPWNGQLWCLDPYMAYDQMAWDRSADLLMACAVLAPFVPRVRLVRASSEEWIPAAAEFLPHIGFVYVDGDHREEAVRRDIALWWPLLKPGGILAGHDLGPTYPGVERAIAELAEPENLTVYRVADVDADSWYVEKPLPDAQPEPDPPAAEEERV